MGIQSNPFDRARIPLETPFQGRLDSFAKDATMFLTELTPLVREFSQNPIAFTGGLFSGIFRLSLTEDPVRSWLDQQAGRPSTSTSNSDQNGKGDGPQSITID